MLLQPLILLPLHFALTSCVRFDYYTNPALGTPLALAYAQTNHNTPHSASKSSSQPGTDAPSTAITQGAQQANQAANYYITNHKAHKGSLTNHHNNEHHKGSEGKELTKKSLDLDGGNSHDNHNQANYLDATLTKAKTAKGGKFSEKKGHKKGHKTKGWHNTFHRDEFIKEHRFYDDAHKTGNYEKRGEILSSFRRGNGGYKNGNRQRDGTHTGEYGRNGKYDKGHNEEENSGFNIRQGDDSYYRRKNKFGKVRKGQQGKLFAYKNKH